MPKAKSKRRQKVTITLSEDAAGMVDTRIKFAPFLDANAEVSPAVQLAMDFVGMLAERAKGEKANAAS